jgi:hypothetical protein
MFAANGKWKRQSSVCLLQTKTEYGSLFTWWANNTVNGNGRLLFQQMCPSILFT